MSSPKLLNALYKKHYAHEMFLTLWILTRKKKTLMSILLKTMMMRWWYGPKKSLVHLSYHFKLKFIFKIHAKPVEVVISQRGFFSSSHAFKKCRYDKSVIITIKNPWLAFLGFCLKEAWLWEEWIANTKIIMMCYNTC